MRLSLVTMGAIGAAIGLGLPTGTHDRQGSSSRHFGFCFKGGGTNCVVDGDTAWIDRVKVRVADIDAPETHPPHCAHEPISAAAPPIGLRS